MGSSRIRFYSRLAALVLAAVVVTGIAALRVRRAEERFGSLTIISYIVAEPAPRHDSPPRKPPSDAPIPAVAADFLGPPSSDAPPRLWTYSAAGEIVFYRPEQYRRCVAARAAHHNEADCPEPHDAHPLVLRRG